MVRSAVPRPLDRTPRASVRRAADGTGWTHGSAGQMPKSHRSTGAICPEAASSRSSSRESDRRREREYRSSDARSTERREGHKPVVIAEADGDERSPSFTDLYRIAADNAAIARALLTIARSRGLARCSRSSSQADRSEFRAAAAGVAAARSERAARADRVPRCATRRSPRRAPTRAASDESSPCAAGGPAAARRRPAARSA